MAEITFTIPDSIPEIQRLPAAACLLSVCARAFAANLTFGQPDDYGVYHLSQEQAGTQCEFRRSMGKCPLDNALHRNTCSGILPFVLPKYIESYKKHRGEL